MIDYSLLLTKLVRNKTENQEVHVNTWFLHYCPKTKVLIQKPDCKSSNNSSFGTDSEEEKSKSCEHLESTVVKTLFTFKGGKNFNSTCGKYTFRLGIIDFITQHSALKTAETELKSRIHNIKAN